MITVYIARYYDPLPERRHLTEHSLGLKLLAEGLSRLYGRSMDTEALTAGFSYGPYGKPYLTAYPDIHFNISHCPGLAACAFSDTPVGIDVERIRPFRDRLLKKALSREEQLLLHRLGTEESAREDCFFRFWTLKESCIKQSGPGLTVPLSSYSFSFDPEPSADCSAICRSHPELFFRQRLLKDGYILSVCTGHKEDILLLAASENIAADIIY